MQKIVTGPAIAWRAKPRSFTKFLLVMKLTSFLLMIGFMSVHATAISQTVTLSGKDIPLTAVFDAITRQTGYHVFGNAALLSATRPVTIAVRNLPVEELMDKVLVNQPLAYRLEGENIIFFTAPEKPATAAPVPDISGVVTDAQGHPLAGASVKIKGSTQGTLTDAAGRFTIAAASNQVLIITFVGYEPVAVPAGRAASVLLQRSDVSLKEIVINKGYYNTTQELNTGDVSTVSSKSIEQQPVSNPLAALEGMVPGMFITQSSGNPGGAFKVQIRGQNSIASGNDPLYVIDGVPYGNATTLQTNNNLNPAGGNPLNFINVNDIESIDVLKDADATAIYGSRGANGVVLITTKKGKAGASRLNFNVYQGVAHVTHMPAMLNTQQYLAMRHEAFRNDEEDPMPDVDVDVLGGSTWDTTRYTDWQKTLIGGMAHYTDAQASLSGGNDNMQYMIGSGYHRESTVFATDAADQKGSVHFTTTGNSNNKKLKVTLTGNYVFDYTTLPNLEATYSLPFLAPDAPPVHTPDGLVNWADGTWVNGNPISFYDQPYKGRTSNLVSNLAISYNILKGLDFKTSMGYTNIHYDQQALYPLSTLDPAYGEISGSSLFNQATSASWIIEPQLNYTVPIWKGELAALVGSSFQQSHDQGASYDATGFTSDLLLANPLAASSITPRNVTDIQYKYNALYGRLSYNLAKKYIVNLTARRDGSSRFGPGRQFANFGSAGAAWIFSKEPWMQIPILSYGKLRASYGTSGNDQVADYTFLDRFNSTTYPYGGTQGLFPASLYNPLLAWEQNRKMEAGLELGFFDDRLYITGSYYRNRSSNQLIAATLSAVTGFNSISENLPATVQNTGAEFLINGKIITQGKFRWSSSFNLTLPRNKLIAFPDLASSSYNNKFIIGQPITILRLYQYAGVNSETGLYQVKGKDGQLTSDPIPVTDAISVVDLAPKAYGGFQNSFSYGHLSLDVLLQFVKQTGNYFLYNGMPGEFSSNQPATVLNRWQKKGDIAAVQRYSQDYSLETATAYAAAAQSNQTYKDASFIRLKNVSLSYSLPDRWKQAMRLQEARIYFQGQNLLTFTKYQGFDPENQSQITLPPLRVMTIGLQVTL